MHSLKSILENVRKGDILTSVDLTEVYLHVLIAPHHRQYLRFCYKGKHLQYRALPFGLASGPKVFTKILAALGASLRARPVRIQTYLDDILVQSTSHERVEVDLGVMVRCLQAHGFSINVGKSHLTPTNHLLHLGAIIDTVCCQVFLSPERLGSIRSMITLIRSTRVVSLAILSTILGKMISCINVMPWARLHV